MTTTLADGLDRIRLVRGWVIGLAVIAIVLGIIALFFPGASLLTIALLFGIYLIASGIYRITTAIAEHRYGVGTRLLVGVLGGLIVVAGILCLSNPLTSIFALGVFIGIGWLIEGGAGLVAFSQRQGRGRWFVLVSALISIIAGIVMLTLPGLGVAVLVPVGGILLIALGVVALLELPSRAAA